MRTGEWTTLQLVFFSSHNLPSILTSYMVSSISLTKGSFERCVLYLAGMELIFFIAACMVSVLDLWRISLSVPTASRLGMCKCLVVRSLKLSLQSFTRKDITENLEDVNYKIHLQDSLYYLSKEWNTKSKEVLSGK